MNPQARIFVAGEQTMIGSAIVRALRRAGFESLVPDLAAEPEYVFVAAGASGGILANQKYPADLCLSNLQVATEILPEAFRRGVKKLLYLGSSCIYPKSCPQPMTVDALMSGDLERTSEAYAIAKLAGIKLCQAYRCQHGAPFITAIPADVYGPGCSFNAEDSHVVPSMISKMHEAKHRGLNEVALWGTGSPRREFTYVDDLAEACLLIMRIYDDDKPINLVSGETTSIRELAEMIRGVVGFEGALRWDTSRPDGAPVKWLDTAPLRALGWRPRTPLKDGISATFHWHLQAT